MRTRIVTSRERKYRQAVWYRWDASRKRAVTEVVAHLGPASPRRSQVDKRKVHRVLAAIRRGGLRESRRTSNRSQSLKGSKRPGMSQVGNAGGRSPTWIDRKAVSQSAACSGPCHRFSTHCGAKGPVGSKVSLSESLDSRRQQPWRWDQTATSGSVVESSLGRISIDEA